MEPKPPGPAVETAAKIFVTRCRVVTRYPVKISPISYSRAPCRPSLKMKATTPPCAFLVLCFDSPDTCLRRCPRTRRLAERGTRKDNERRRNKKPDDRSRLSHYDDLRRSCRAGTE